MSVIYKIYHFVYDLYHQYLLRFYQKRGLVIGKNFYWHITDTIDSGFAWLITIGDDVTLADRVCILAHDASTANYLKYRKIGKVIIGNRVYIGFNSIILPGVTVGDDVIIGAGSVVTNDIPSRSVAVGNPARVVSTLDEFIENKRKEIGIYPIFERGYTVGGNINDTKKREMVAKMKDKFGYVT